MKEIWCDIKGYKGLYQVSSKGRVRSLSREVSRCDKKRGFYFGKVMKQAVACGYAGIVLCKAGHSKRYLVHRLVAHAFIPNPENKPQVNHKNGNKLDNNVDNLEWVTRSENMKHSFLILGRKASMFGKKREDNPLFGRNRNCYWLKGKTGRFCANSKIIQQIKDNIVVAEFYGTLEAQRETGINASNITSVCKGSRMTAGKYIWKYKKE